MPHQSYSVIIPVYNSKESLPPLLSRLVPVLESLGAPYEVLLVNDGSPDSSWRVICDLVVHYDCVRGINLMRNYGQHNALLCGINAAQHEISITLDDDLQHPPEEIPRLLDALTDAVDVVYGPPQEEQHSLMRNMASQATKFAMKGAMGVNVAQDVSAFRVFRTQLRDAFRHYNGPYVSIDVLLTWATTQFTSIKVRHEPRTIGASNYTFRKLVRHALNMITGFSTLPLRLASWLGFAFTLFGMGVLAYVIITFFTLGRVVPGFAFQSSIIALFSGAQLFALGIMGEYLARMHFQVMDRPRYTIREEIAHDDQ